MKFKRRLEYSRLTTRSVMLRLMGAAILLGSAGLMFAMPQVPEAPPTPSAATAAPPRLNAVRTSVAPEAVTLTIEVSGEFTYDTPPAGDRLVFVDIPQAISAEPSQSRILESPFVSSYRVTSYLRDGRPNARLEVLLKKPAALTVNKLPGALAVKLTAAGVTQRIVSAAPAKPTAAAPLRARGNAIEKVSIAREDGAVRVQILTNGPVEYKAFQLSNPARLVVDIPAAESRTGNREIPVGVSPLKSVRVAQFSHAPLVSRIVIDLEKNGPYQVHPRDNMVEVEVGQPSMKANPAEAKPRPIVAESKAPTNRPATAGYPSPDISVPPSVANVMATMPAAHAAPTGAERSGLLPVAPPPLAPMNVAKMMTPAPQATPQTQQRSTAPTTTGQQPMPPQTTSPGQQPAIAGPEGPGVAPGPLQPRYTGEPISVNLKDVDLKDFFRLIHEISGLNIVLDPNVSGRLTIVLEDVPWDQALDIVLRNNSLDKQLEGNVLRIARRTTLRQEEEERFALETAKQAAAEKVTAMRTLNYARASEMMATLSKFRSPRGEIIADERTNTLIITDIPQVIPIIDDIIRQLDRRTVQVEIEARVVAASRSFARSVGAQFGFMTSAAGRRTLFQGAGAGVSPIILENAPGPVELIGNQLPLFSNFPAAGSLSGFSIVHRSPNANIDFIITLAETRGLGRLLSRPRIITQNNRQGQVQQGLRIPVQTTINNTISVQFINATLSLTVRPQVTNDGSIFLDVTVDNSAIDPGTPRINGVPALSTQLATTQVLVNDGSTVVFGGVLQNQNNVTIQQVPLLGSIPVIGHLFKNTGVTTQTNELLFFITPKIV